jgi:hypothetical protein
MAGKDIATARFITVMTLMMHLGIRATYDVGNLGAYAGLVTTSDEHLMETLWADLEGKEADAARAMLKMAARPNESVLFLKAKLKPLKIEPDQVRALLAKLASHDERVWKPAYEELEYFDPRLAIDLETLMNEVTEAPARQRMVEVLSGARAGSLEDKTVILRRVGRGDRFVFFSEGGSFAAEHVVARINHSSNASPKKKWTRAVRAIVLLEHVGTVGILRACGQSIASHRAKYRF